MKDAFFGSEDREKALLDRRAREKQILLEQIEERKRRKAAEKAKEEELDRLYVFPYCYYSALVVLLCLCLV